MKIGTEILFRGQSAIPHYDFEDLVRVVESVYQQSSRDFIMWKIFQFGFVYGKRAERARRKK